MKLRTWQTIDLKLQISTGKMALFQMIDSNSLSIPTLLSESISKITCINISISYFQKLYSPNVTLCRLHHLFVYLHFNLPRKLYIPLSIHKTLHFNSSTQAQIQQPHWRYLRLSVQSLELLCEDNSAKPQLKTSWAVTFNLTPNKMMTQKVRWLKT